MHVLKKIVLPVTMAFCAMSATAATYTQTVPGHNGPMTVKVAIDNGKITAVEVVKHSETAGVGTKAIEALPAKIVKANSTKVDVVTGASVSSKGILRLSTKPSMPLRVRRSARPSSSPVRTKLLPTATTVI